MPIKPSHSRSPPILKSRKLFRPTSGPGPAFLPQAFLETSPFPFSHLFLSRFDRLYRFCKPAVSCTYTDVVGIDMRLRFQIAQIGFACMPRLLKRLCFKTNYPHLNLNNNSGKTTKLQQVEEAICK